MDTHPHPNFLIWKNYEGHLFQHWGGNRPFLPPLAGATDNTRNSSSREYIVENNVKYVLILTLTTTTTTHTHKCTRAREHGICMRTSAWTKGQRKRIGVYNTMRSPKGFGVLLCADNQIITFLSHW